MINLSSPPAFLFILNKPDAVPLIVPMSQWIFAANDDVMFSDRKK